MQLPAHILKKKQAAAQEIKPEAELKVKSKYPDAAVKMLAIALDDIHMIKFKSGWFTMVKYDYAVFEMKNVALREELVAFGQENKIEKPETWIKDIKIRNKFLDQEQKKKPVKEIKKFVKPNLRLGGGAKEEEKQEVLKVDEPSIINPISSPVSKPEEQSPAVEVSSAQPKSQSKMAIKRQRMLAQQKAGAIAPSGLQQKFAMKMNLRLGSAAIEDDQEEEKKSEKLSEKPSQPVQMKKPALMLQTKQITVPAPKPQLQINSNIQVKAAYPQTIQKTKEIWREPIPERSFEQDKSQDMSKDFSHNQNKSFENNGRMNLSIDKLNISISSDKIKEDEVEDQLLLPTKQIKPQLTLQLSAPQISLSQIVDNKTKQESENLQTGTNILQKLIKRRLFLKYQSFIKLQKKNEFQIKLENFLLRKYKTRKLRQAFDQMKINCLSLEIQNKMQDKYQVYARYVRRFIQVFSNTFAHSSHDQMHQNVRKAFTKWKDETSYLKILHQRASEVGQIGQQDFVSSYLIQSVSLSKESINQIQDENIIYLKSMRNDYQFKQIKSQEFYGLLFSKFEKITKLQKIKAYNNLRIHGNDIISNSFNIIKKIRANVIYLKDIKQSLKNQEERQRIDQQKHNLRGSQIPNSFPISMGTLTPFIDNQAPGLSITTPQIVQGKLKFNQTESKSIIIQANTSVQNISTLLSHQFTEAKKSESKDGDQNIRNPLYQSMISASEYTNTYQLKPPRLHSLDDNSSLYSNFTNIKNQAIQSQNQKITEQYKQNTDKDDQYLFHIERQLNENLSLLKLFQRVQNQYIKQRSIVSQDEKNINEDQIEEITNKNKSKLNSISKIIGIEFRISNLIVCKLADCKQVVRMFRKWQLLNQIEKQSKQNDQLNTCKLSQIKCAFNILSMKFDNKELIRRKFRNWHNFTIVTKNKGWNANFVRNYSQQIIGKGSLSDLNKRENFGSNNISFIDQKVHQKMTSFMKINKLIIYQYIQKGTILQKYIDNLKFLAQQQNINNRRMKQISNTHQSQNDQRVSFNAQHQTRQFQADQRIIEENVNKIIEGIRRIIFNRWVLFTQHQIKFDSEPKQQGCQRILAAMEKMYQRNKMEALSKIHLYNLHIETKQVIHEEQDTVYQQDSYAHKSTVVQRRQVKPNQQISNKLQSNCLSLFIIKNSIQKQNLKKIQRFFSSWKFKTKLFEWRMSQSMVSMSSVMNMDGSQNLQKIFDQLKEKNGAVQTVVQEKKKANLIEIPPLVALKANGLQIQIQDSYNANDKNNNFFDNYFTPKSAAIQQKLQKPWEIKQRRDKLKHISIYGGAIQAQSILKRSFNEIDKNMKQLIFINSERVDLAKALNKWLRHTKSLRNKLRPMESQRLLNIMKKLGKNKLIKKFMLWKYSLQAKEAYPLQCEYIDSNVIKAISYITVDLMKDIKQTKSRYKDLVKLKALTRIVQVSKDSNPMKEAFKIWKTFSCPIIAHIDELMHSNGEKEELKQQYDLLNEQNNETQKRYIQQVNKSTVDSKNLSCQVCIQSKIEKIDEKTQIHYNQANYKELHRLVGSDGVRQLLDNPEHIEKYQENEMNESSDKGSFIKMMDQKSENELSPEQYNDYGDNQDQTQFRRQKTDTAVASQGRQNEQDSKFSLPSLIDFHHQPNTSIENLSSINQMPGNESDFINQNHYQSQSSMLNPPGGKKAFNLLQQMSTSQKRTQMPKPVTIPPSGSQKSQGIITGAGGQADELAHMIEHENQRLRTKNQQIREQFLQKNQYIASEKQKFIDKIKKLRELRDNVMLQYENKMMNTQKS